MQGTTTIKGTVLELRADAKALQAGLEQAARALRQFSPRLYDGRRRGREFIKLGLERKYRMAPDAYFGAISQKPHRSKRVL